MTWVSHGSFYLILKAAQVSQLWCVVPWEGLRLFVPAPSQTHALAALCSASRPVAILGTPSLSAFIHTLKELGGARPKGRRVSPSHNLA